jgi:hypothetical protein
MEVENPDYSKGAVNAVANMQQQPEFRKQPIQLLLQQRSCNLQLLPYVLTLDVVCTTYWVVP